MKKVASFLVRMIVGLIFLSILLVALALIPVIVYAVGWVFGWLVMLVFGEAVLGALHSVGLVGISAQTVPVITGIIGVIGSFFKTTVSSSSK